MKGRQAGLSSSLLSSRRIDAICGQFESAWRSGQRPSIETLVAAAEPEDRSGLLAELVVLELELRTVAGERTCVEEYLARFPGDEQVVRAALAPPDVPIAARHNENREAWPAAERYQLGDQVGRGGMGVVLRARDRQLDRELAVKLLAEPLQTRREARERFLREARIGAQLQHPGIIPVHEMGWLGKRPYYAMKLVQGQSLAELLQGRSSPDPELPRWLEVLERACEAVAYAHAQGIVHRDLKPANVMLGSFGEVYVIDWGLAKRMPPDKTSRAALPDAEQGTDGDSRDAWPVPTGADSAAPEHDSLAPPPDASAAWTFLGDVVGTPQYMSPEQARGDAIDQRADVFALGAMLAEILTGSPPYSAGEPSVRLEQAQQGNLAETLARLDACPADRELIDLARDCLAVQPAARPTRGTCRSGSRLFGAVFNNACRGSSWSESKPGRVPRSGGDGGESF